MTFMRKALDVAITIALACGPAAAQEAAGVQTRPDPAVAASSSVKGVRFVAPGAGRVRLEVYTQAGERVFDSDFRAGGVLDWDVRGLPDGAYLCVLTAEPLQGGPTRTQVGVKVEGGRAALDKEGGEQLKSAALTVTAHDGQDGQVTSTTGALTFRTGDVFTGQEREQMRVTADGRVGIGTADPEATLDVAGAIRAQGGIVFPDGSVMTTARSMSKAAPATTNADGLSASAVAGAGTANRLTKWTDAAGTLGDSVITESSGNVGIGTATPNPNGVLHVHKSQGTGTSLFVTNDNASAGALSSLRAGLNPSDYAVDYASLNVLGAGWTPGAGGSFLKGKTGLLESAGSNFGIGNINNTEPIIFYTTSQRLERMRLTAAGNFGVGTASPAERLEVAGNVKVSGTGSGIVFPDGSKLVSANGLGGGGSMTGTSIVAAVNDAATAGTINDNRLSANVARLDAANAWAAGQSVNGDLNATGKVGGGSLAVDWNTLAVASDTHRVGLGTFAPAAKLDIVGGAAFNGGSDPVAVAFEFQDGGYRHFIRTRHNATPGSGNAIDFYVNNSSTAAGSTAPGAGSLHTLTLDSGRVGVGTTSPAYKLHVSAGTGGSSLGLRVETAAAGATLASFGNVGDFNIDAANSAGGRFTVKENGNVGIGVANPTSKLNVGGNVSVSGSVIASGNLSAASLSATGSVSGASINASGGVSAASLNTTGNITAGGSLSAQSVSAKGDVTAAANVNAAGSVTAASFKFSDGSAMTTAVGTTYTSLRDAGAELAASGQPQTSVAHLDVAAGSYLLTATFRLTNTANLSFQNNSRGVTCTLGGDAYAFTLPASTEVGATQVFTLHGVAVLGAAGGLDLTCGATTGGADRSYVSVTQRRLTATKVGGFVVQ